MQTACKVKKFNLFTNEIEQFKSETRQTFCIFLIITLTETSQHTLMNLHSMCCHNGYCMCPRKEKLLWSSRKLIEWTLKCKTLLQINDIKSFSNPVWLCRWSHTTKQGQLLLNKFGLLNISFHYLEKNKQMMLGPFYEAINIRSEMQIKLSV